MVSPKEEEVFRESELVAEEKHDTLDRVLASVDVISNEEVVAVSRIAAVLENLEQVTVLAVDIACMREQVPQILTGAYSSSNIGCYSSNSRLFMQTVRI